MRVSPPVSATRRAMLSSRPHRTRGPPADSGTTTRRQTTSTATASALSRPVRGGSGRSRATSRSRVSRPSLNLTRRPSVSGTRSTTCGLDAVSPRTSSMRTVTRRGGITAWAVKATALSMIVISSLARVSPAANSRLSVISTQTPTHAPTPSAATTRLGRQEGRTRSLDRFRPRPAPPVVPEPARRRPGDEARRHPQSQRAPADPRTRYRARVRLAGGPGERDPQLEMAHARFGAVPAAGEVARQGGTLGETELTVELEVDLLYPFVVVHGSSSRTR